MTEGFQTLRWNPVLREEVVRGRGPLKFSAHRWISQAEAVSVIGKNVWNFLLLDCVNARNSSELICLSTLSQNMKEALSRPLSYFSSAWEGELGLLKWAASKYIQISLDVVFS